VKNIIIILVLLVIFGGGLYYINTNDEKLVEDILVVNIDKTEPNIDIEPSVPDGDSNKTIVGDPVEPTNPVMKPVVNKGVSASDFKNRINEIALEENLIPIEGFDAFTLMSVFPGLTEIDFERVVTLEGHYEISTGELKYVRDKDQPVTSAEQTLSLEGYGTLLSNVAIHAGISLRDEENLEAIIAVMQTDPSEIPIQNEFPEKIVYGDNMSLKQSDLRLDCDSRGGTFNTCGSVCPNTAEMCTEQCAYTCELTDVPVF